MKNRLVSVVLTIAVLLLSPLAAPPLVVRSQENPGYDASAEQSAAARVISANPGFDVNVGGVQVLSSNPEQAPEAIVPPSDLASSADALSFHVKNKGVAGAQPGDGRYVDIAAVIDKIYEYPDAQTKPVIISDDGCWDSMYNCPWNRNTRKCDDDPTTHQCRTDVMTKALQKAQDNGLHFEHNDAIRSSSTQAASDQVRKMLEILKTGGPPGKPRYKPTDLNALREKGALGFSGRNFTWSGKKIERLVGFSFLGAMADSADYNGYKQRHMTYLNLLKEYNINLTRVFLVDPWARDHTGAYPFFVCQKPCGTPPYTNYSWDLLRFNDPGQFAGACYNYFERLQHFVDQAWVKGIVVQIAMFDQCGLQYRDGKCNVAREQVWTYNPYRKIFSCASPQVGFSTNETSGCQRYPKSFTDFDDTTTAKIHRALIGQIVSALAGYKNVMYEIMNEPHQALFADGGGNPKRFHNWVRSRIDGT